MKKSKTTWLIIPSFDLLVYFLKKYVKVIFSFDFQLFQFAAECF